MLAGHNEDPSIQHHWTDNSKRMAQRSTHLCWTNVGGLLRMLWGCIQDPSSGSILTGTGNQPRYRHRPSGSPINNSSRGTSCSCSSLIDNTITYPNTKCSGRNTEPTTEPHTFPRTLSNTQPPTTPSTYSGTNTHTWPHRCNADDTSTDTHTNPDTYPGPTSRPSYHTRPDTFAFNRQQEPDPTPTNPYTTTRP